MDTPICKRRCNLHRDLGLWYGVIIDAKRVGGQPECGGFGAFMPKLCDIWNYVDNAEITIILTLQVLMREVSYGL